MSTNAVPNFSDDLIPIIVGITGHRDLLAKDIATLSEKVRGILKDLKRDYPDTPLWMLSPLAEGADRLAARAALEPGADGTPLAQLIVPLPMPREEYEKDFQSQESKAEFAQLLSQATKTFELPLRNSVEAIRTSQDSRNEQYTQVGAYIARNCQILIALWDGQKAEKAGGTSQIVRFRLSGDDDAFAQSDPLDIRETGPVRHVVTPHSSFPTPADAFAVKLVPPPVPREIVDEENSSSLILDHMNTFNRDVKRLIPDRNDTVETSKSYVMPAEIASTLPSTARSLLRRYAVADTLAMYFQVHRRRTLLRLFGFAIAAVMSFEVYAHLVVDRPWVLLFYPFTLGCAIAVYYWSSGKTIWKWRGRDFQNKHLDYRVLAEGLRVQLFWHLAGVSKDVADHYLRKQLPELGWIRNAIRSWNAASESPSGDFSTSLEKLVKPYWIKDQLGYFERAARRDHQNLEKHEHRVSLLFGATLVLAFGVFALHTRFEHYEGFEFWHHLLIVIMGILPAIAAAIGGYAEKMAFFAQTKRYRWMRDLFMRAEITLRRLAPTKVDENRHVLFHLGKEALEENGDWISIHRERTPDYRKS